MRTLYFWHVICICLVSSFSSPNLSGRRFIQCLPYFHTWCGLSVNLKCISECAARSSLKIQNAKNRHLGTIAQLRRTISKVCIDNLKKDLLNINTSSTRPHRPNMVNFGQITAENCWRVWGTPANFNGFRVLAALLHGTPAVGVSQTLRH